MAYDAILADRVRSNLPSIGVVEHKMMGGLVFMLHNKMCVYLQDDKLIVRCPPEVTDKLLRRPGAQRMVMHGRTAKEGWIAVGPRGTKYQEDLEYWVKIALDFNEVLHQ